MVTRDLIFSLMSRLYRKMRYSKERRKCNLFVKKYYTKYKRKDFEYTRNIWSSNYLWDFYYQSLPNSTKSKYYVPADYYAFEIEPVFNKEFTCYCLEKNMFDKIFSGLGVRLPTTILRCMNGVYLDKHYRLIDDAESFCAEINEDIIVKPTVHSCGGENIKKYFFHNGALCHDNSCKFELKEIARFYGGNFIVQGVVDQNLEIAKFHPYSLNTIRAFSYRSIRTNKVHVTMSILRMGVNRSYLDNSSIDGIACGVGENGILMKYAFDQYGNSYTHHPNTGKRFENFVVPSFNRVMIAIRELSNVLSHQRMIGWDFGISRDCNPVLIEANIGTSIWMLQIANGRPLFGTFSQEVKDYMDSIG